MSWSMLLLVVVALMASPAMSEITMHSYALSKGEHPHDVAPDPEGTAVWYTAQHIGSLGQLDPVTGETRLIPLGEGSAPHGVIVGPDGAPWVTDSGLNAIVRVDPETRVVKRFPLPQSAGYANLNTAAFDGEGILWFTGQAGIYGRLDPGNGEMAVFAAPRGRGPYGIAATPNGDIYFASLAGNYLGHIDRSTGAATVLEPPTPDQGARRVWSDSLGRLWVSEWHSGQLSYYQPSSGEWRSWPLPGKRPRAYAVYVDEEDKIWVSDFGGNAIHRFDPKSEHFESYPSPRSNAKVRQLLGRTGEIWAPESGTDHLVVFRID